MRFWNRPTEANSSPERNPISCSCVFFCAINSVQQKITGATRRANISNPEASGSSISTTTNAGIVARLKIRVAATEIGTACPIVASRAVATAARITAVEPCGQLLRIQNELTTTTARAARRPVHSATTGSLKWVKPARRSVRFSPERWVS